MPSATTWMPTTRARQLTCKKWPSARSSRGVKNENWSFSSQSYLLGSSSFVKLRATFSGLCLCRQGECSAKATNWPVNCGLCSGSDSYSSSSGANHILVSNGICRVASLILARFTSEHVDNVHMYTRRALTCLPTGIEQTIGSIKHRR